MPAGTAPAVEVTDLIVRYGSDGEVTAVATQAHGGRTLATYDIVISDAEGHLVCTSRLTCLIRDQVPGESGNGQDHPGKRRVIIR